MVSQSASALVTKPFIFSATSARFSGMCQLYCVPLLVPRTCWVRSFSLAEESQATPAPSEATPLPSAPLHSTHNDKHPNPGPKKPPQLVAGLDSRLSASQHNWLCQGLNQPRETPSSTQSPRSFSGGQLHGQVGDVVLAGAGAELLGGLAGHHAEALQQRVQGLVHLRE